MGDEPVRDQGGTQGERPAVTISKAAELCGVSRDVIKRKLRADAFPNAVQLDDRARTWKIPITDLGAAGLTPGKPSPPDASSNGHATPAGDVERVRELERRLLLTEADRDRWKAIADERGRTIEVTTLALKRVPELEGPAARRRRWFR